jgi:hypothetical protein
MRRISVPVVASILVVAGAAAMAVGQVAALTSGQFARWERLVEEEHIRFAATQPSAGPAVPLHIPFLFCMPLLFPAAYAWIVVWCMRHPIDGVHSRRVRVLIHVAWAAWCAGVILFSMAFGAVGRVWGDLQWEWPGFFIESVGSWLSVAGHGVAALWRPARA